MKLPSAIIGLTFFINIPVSYGITANDEKLFFFFKNNFAAECEKKMHIGTKRLNLSDMIFLKKTSLDSNNTTSRTVSATSNNLYHNNYKEDDIKEIYQIQNPQIYYKSILSEEDILDEDIISNIRVYIAGKSYRQLKIKESETFDTPPKQYFKAVINVRWKRNQRPSITINNINNDYFPSDRIQLSKTKQFCI